MTKPTQTAYDWWLETNTQEIWAYTEKVFTDEEINFITRKSPKSDTYPGKIGSAADEKELLSYRNSTISHLESSDESNNWVFERITRAVVEINNQFWKFDLNRIETLQYSEYTKGQFYKRHIDSLYHTPGKGSRKLSFSVQLSDSNEYEGGDLLTHIGTEPMETSRKKGTIVFFPSYILHEVTPVTKGTRRALVGWVTGPSFK
jgi:PKHD-type hydroxylase